MRIFLTVILTAGFAFAQAPPAPAKPAAAKPAASKAGAAKAGAAKTGAAAAPAPLGPTAAQRVKLMSPASLKAVAPVEYKVKFTTLKDQSFVVDIHRDWAPHGADRFYNLVKNGFFTGVRFYRVAPGFVTQFGLSPDPKITMAWHAAQIPGDPVKEKNTKGRLTFAMGASPDSRTTQLFFNLADNSRLDPMGFAPIGEVIENPEVVDGLFGGYGEIKEQGGGGPAQMNVAQEGEKYLKANFDKLDTIKSAIVISPVPTAAPAKPAMKKTAPAPKAAAPTKK